MSIDINKYVQFTTSQESLEIEVVPEPEPEPDDVPNIVTETGIKLATDDGTQIVWKDYNG